MFLALPALIPVVVLAAIGAVLLLPYIGVGLFILMNLGMTGISWLTGELPLCRCFNK